METELIMTDHNILPSNLILANASILTNDDSRSSMNDGQNQNSLPGANGHT